MLYPTSKNVPDVGAIIAEVFNGVGSSPVVPPPVAGRAAVDLTPKQVIFNPPATIVYWNDGTKTVVRADNDVFSEEFGYAMACMRKIYGTRAEFKAQFKNAIRPQQKPVKPKKATSKTPPVQEFVFEVIPKPQVPVVPSLNQMLKDLAGDDSMGVQIGFRTKDV